MSNITAMPSKSTNDAQEIQEIRALTGIRGFAAALVVLGHYQGAWSTLVPFLHRLDALASHGGQGVDLFFILSGFILSYVYKGAQRTSFGVSQYGRFVCLRFARLWPNHIATLIFLALLVFVAKHRGTTLGGAYPLAGLPFQITMTHAWPLIPEGPWGWNYPSWSISTEWFAYLFLFPAVWRALDFKLKPPLWFGLCYVFLAIWLFVLFPTKIEWCDLIGRVTCEFLAGAMLFNTYRKSETITRFCQRSVFFVWLALLAGLCFLPSRIPLALPAIALLFPILLLGLTEETSATARFFASPPILWSGRVSYALYMSHGVVQKVLKVLLPLEHYQYSSLTIRLLLLLAYFLILILAAALLYYAVEIPARHFLRQFAARWRNKTSVAKVFP